MKKYALTLHRLVFGVLRQMDPSYPHKYRYPTLHSTQLVFLQALKAGLIDEKPDSVLNDLYQSACFTLFAHHQHKYETSLNLNQFFSPVICFLVLISCRERGGFHLPSVISQFVAHIVFSIRSSVFVEIDKKAKTERIGLCQ